LSVREARTIEERQGESRMTATVDVRGECDERLSNVRDEFVRNFAERGDLGAAFAVTIDGQPVIDLWGGYLDEARTRPWQRDSIVNVWSIGKAMTAVCTLQLVEQGRLDLDAAVADYWPEFASGGKQALPLHMLLSHRAGLPAVGRPLQAGASLEWETMTRALAEQEPWWEPGTLHGYHTNTYGHLAGEVVRRTTGRSLGTYFHDEIARPLGVDFYIGFGPEHDHRVAEWVNYTPPEGVQDPPRRPWLEQDPAQLEGVELGRYMAYRNPAAGGPSVNTRAWRAAEFPSTNPHSNARSLARIFGALASGGEVDGVRLLQADTIERAAQVEADGEDAVLGRPTRFGLGFQLTMSEIRPMGPNPGAFGHYGAGAVVAFADPQERIGLAFVCNQAGRAWRDPRNIALIDAVYEAL
jgi:CubicO group peptidase (beta-lactamase class C family)